MYASDPRAILLTYITNEADWLGKDIRAHESYNHHDVRPQRTYLSESNCSLPATISKSLNQVTQAHHHYFGQWRTITDWAGDERERDAIRTATLCE